jgi:transposase, IS5 family
VPWPAFCAVIEPYYPKPGNGRPPIGVERMLRLYFLQQWFNLSDRWLKRRSTIRRRRAGLSASISAASRCLTKPRCAASAICSKPTVSAGGYSIRGSGTSPRTGCRWPPARLSMPPLFTPRPRPRTAPRARDPEMHQTKKGNR